MEQAEFKAWKKLSKRKDIIGREFRWSEYSNFLGPLRAIKVTKDEMSIILNWIAIERDGGWEIYSKKPKEICCGSFEWSSFKVDQRNKRVDILIRDIGLGHLHFNKKPDQTKVIGFKLKK